MITRTLALCSAFLVVAASSAEAQKTTTSVAAPTSAQASAPAEATRAASRSSRDLIVAADLQGNTVGDALEAVQKLKPHWTRVRGRSSLSRSEQVMVHIDNIPSGGIQSLRRVRATEVVEIRHLDGIAATQRFGTGYGAGAILVTTR